MKGIILAGGTGSRLYPLTKVTNKHLLPVGQEPMIFHPLRKLLEANIRNIMVVTGTEHMGAVVGLLGSGRDLDADLTYRVQDTAGGIAQALGLCENFVGTDRCCVILGDNIWESPLTPFVRRFMEQRQGARVLLKVVTDPERFGVATLQGDHIVRIVEKPTHSESKYAVTGVYFYDHQVFNIIKNLKPSARAELEITDVNNAYLQTKQLTFDILEGYWTDAGTFDSWKYANDLVLSHAVQG